MASLASITGSPQLTFCTRLASKAARDVAIFLLLGYGRALRRGEVVELDLEHFDPRGSRVSDGFGLDQAIGRARLTESLRTCGCAHSTLPALRGEPVKGCQERLAANVGAEGLNG